MDAPDYDVVVVGAGGAGLAAAATAAEQGASVLLVEAAEQVGGSTAYAAGSFMAAGTPTQEAAGHPGDTVEEFVDYYTALNQWQVDPPVVRRFCEEATPTMRWLTGLGVEFAPAGLYRAQLERIPRSHRPVGAGQALVDALHAAVRASGADVALGNRVDGLLTSEGRVHGVSARGEAVTATSVVVTTGGFGANGDLVREHMPEVAKAGEWVWSPAAPTCLGDGLGLAVKAGAATTGAGKGEVLLTPGFGRELEPFLPGWLVFVNAAGRRFVNEAAPYAALSKLVSAEGGRCFVVMDEATRAAARPNPASAMFGGGSWEADFIAARAGEGRIARAATIEDLAARLGVPAVMLASTVERYNADAALGVDSRFEKAATHLRPIATPPFYGIEIRAAVVAVTGFGVRIDADGRVLAEEDDRPVPGLYAAGEVVGNVLGPLYLGGGNAVGSAIVFGRVAGRAAAGPAGRP